MNNDKGLVMPVLDGAADQSSTSEPRSTSCQGSMGLHQNNFNFEEPLPFHHNLATATHENTIAEVFRRFCDRCILKLRDGMHFNPDVKNKQKEKSEKLDDFVLPEGHFQEEPKVRIDDLPIYCKLIILSKLDTTDICNLSMASRHWREVCSDQFLWRELLYRDMCRWHSVGHKSYPLASLSEFFEAVEVPFEGQSDEQENHATAAETEDTCIPKTAYDLRARLCFKNNINFKALYFHCAYQRRYEAQMIGVTSFQVDNNVCDSAASEQDSIVNSEQQLASNQSFPRFLRSLWMRMRSGNGDVIMLGPGMESQNTSKIFRRLLWARPDLLITQRLLPGSQDGVGSGVELDFKGEKRFNLIALYSGNHRERRNRFGLQRLQHSNIIEQVEGDDFGIFGQEYASTPETKESESSTSTAVKPKSSLKFKLQELVLNFLKQRVDTYRLIYVVDATQSVPLGQLACNRHELQALLEGIRSCENNLQESEEETNPVQRHPSGEASASALSSLINFTGISSTSTSAAPRRPVLVLCCVQFPHVARIPCVEVASLLDLASIKDRPWQVQDVTVNDLNGLENGLVWLFKQD